MKALILNSGVGSRMSGLTKHNPKCLTRLTTEETILERQLGLLKSAGIADIVITTGYMQEMIIEACRSYTDTMRIEFIENAEYRHTNYIYSIYLAKENLYDDILLLHGDLVFDNRLIADMLMLPDNYMVVSLTRTIPSKDFKAVLRDGKITEIGVNCFENAVYSQPLYKLNRSVWDLWLKEIIRLSEENHRDIYAEDALNKLLNITDLYPYDIGMRLCMEIDTPDDLSVVNNELLKVV